MFLPPELQAQIQAQLKAQEAAIPKLPGFESQTGPGGLMQSQFQTGPALQAKLDAIKMDPRGLDAFRQEALRKGPSGWAALQNKSLGLQEQTARQQAAAQAAQGMAQGRAGLAMRGGLSGGASERMARAGGLGMLQAQQDIGRQGMQNRLSVATEDEKQRMAALGQLPGMEVQALQPELEKTKMWGQSQQFDLANALKEAQNKREYEMKKYEEENKRYMGDQMAQAEREKDKGSCWLVSAISRHSPLPTELPELLTQFKRYCLKRDKSLSKFYIERCGQLIERMDVQHFDWKHFRWFSDALTSLLRNGELRGAYSLFVSTVAELVTRYWPQCEEKEAQDLREYLTTKRTEFRRPIEIKLVPGEEKLAVECLQNIPRNRFV